jgi:hypothetical protein
MSGTFVENGYCYNRSHHLGRLPQNNTILHGVIIFCPLMMGVGSGDDRNWAVWI